MMCEFFLLLLSLQSAWDEIIALVVSTAFPLALSNPLPTVKKTLQLISPTSWRETVRFFDKMHAANALQRFFLLTRAF